MLLNARRSEHALIPFLIARKQRRQLGDVRRDAARLVHRQHLAVSACAFVSRADIGERLHIRQGCVHGLKRRGIA